jgi:hypothetical protein
LLGLYGDGYQYVSGAGTYTFSSVSSLNDAGQANGSSKRYNTSGTSLGQDTWVWTGSSTQQTGFTGNGYEYTYTGTGGGTFRSSSVSMLNAAGQTTGSTNRYNTSAQSLGRDTWIWTGSSTQQTGLTGTDYEYAYTGAGGGTYRFSSAFGLGAAGNATGYSNRYNSAGNYLGQDTWAWTGASTQQIGLTGSAYEYAYTGAGAGIYRSSALFANLVNGAGQLVGETDRFDSSGIGRGRDLWIWTGSSTQQIGLTGPGYDYTTSGGFTGRDSFPTNLNSAGQAVGYSYRYNSRLGNSGHDAWIWTGSSTQRIGLIGAEYEYPDTRNGGIFRLSQPGPMNDAGQTTGISNRYTSGGLSVGLDIWIWTGSSTQQIGLTGAGYEYSVTGGGGGTYRSSTYSAQLTAGGQACGYSNRYNTSGAYLGQDVWMWTGTATQQIPGLTGSDYQYTYTGNGGGTYRISSPGGMNDAGQMLGATNRFNSSGGNLGQDAWIWSGSSTQQIGLTGAAYEYPYTGAGGGTYRYSSAFNPNPSGWGLNADGQTAGYSQRYNSAGRLMGYDTWVWTGSSTQQTGLTGTGYEYTYTGTGGGTYRSSQTTGLNEAGQAVGYNYRYDASGNDNGQDAWFFDPQKSSTTALRFSFRSSDDYSYSQAAMLTDQGVVLGKYELFSGSTDLGSRAFWWSSSDGFYDLGSLVNGNLSNDGWQYLYDVVAQISSGNFSNIAGGSPWCIVGDGLTNGQSGGQSVYLLAVPEPSGTVIFLIATGSLLWRRRR